MDILSKLVKNEFVKGFPHNALKKKKLRDACCCDMYNVE
jgi:hypothetical protein